MLVYRQFVWIAFLRFWITHQILLEVGDASASCRTAEGAVWCRRMRRIGIKLVDPPFPQYQPPWPDAGRLQAHRSA